jgi:putative MATE family efflux protein
MMRTKDMTTGNPYRLLTELALPLLGGNLLQQVYSIVDTMIVGRCIGTEALAAVGCTGALTWLILGFIIGLAQGFSICISQCYGRKDICGTVISVRMSMLLTLIFGIAITVFGMCAAIPLLKLLGTPKKIAGDAAVYIEIIMAGSLAAAFYNITSAVLRAFGNGMVPLISIIISTVLNIFLDILFIVTFNMGVAGAAYATVISQFVSGLFLLYCNKKYT